MCLFHLKAFLDFCVLYYFLRMLFVTEDQGFVEVEVGNHVLVFLSVDVFGLEHGFEGVLTREKHIFVAEVVSTS